MNTSRLPGHGLRAEGAAFGAHATRSRDSSGAGMALCECGIYSPLLKNRSLRKQWHRDHKDDIRQGGTGIVWQGVTA